MQDQLERLAGTLTSHQRPEEALRSHLEESRQSLNATARRASTLAQSQHSNCFLENLRQFTKNLRKSLSKKQLKTNPKNLSGTYMTTRPLSPLSAAFAELLQGNSS